MGQGAEDADESAFAASALMELREVMHRSPNSAPRVSRLMDEYSKNKAAPVGAIIVCPVCNKTEIKRTKAQAFCSVKRKGRSSCRDKYHNTVSAQRAARAVAYNGRYE